MENELPWLVPRRNTTSDAREEEASGMMLAPAKGMVMAMTAVLVVVVLVPQPLLTTSMMLAPEKETVMATTTVLATGDARAAADAGAGKEK